MKNIEFSNCMQVIGIFGILPNRVCGRARSNKLMDLQISNNLPSETEKRGWERGGFNLRITFSGTEMLKWFNHQSVDNSIFFSVGRNFPKLVVCIVLGLEGFDGFVEISINGYENREYESIHLSRNYIQFVFTQYLFSLTQWSLLQRHLNESNPTDQNRVKVSIRCKSDDTCYSIKRWGVHVECTCPPQESAIPNLPLLTAGHDDDDDVDYMRELPFYGSDDKEVYQSPLVHNDDVDYWRELPFYGSDDKEEHQSPLVHDDTSMSCMSWLVGPTTKLFKLFFFCCPRAFS